MNDLKCMWRNKSAFKARKLLPIIWGQKDFLKDSPSLHHLWMRGYQGGIKTRSQSSLCLGSRWLSNSLNEELNVTTQRASKNINHELLILIGLIWQYLHLIIILIKDRQKQETCLHSEQKEAGNVYGVLNCRLTAHAANRTLDVAACMNNMALITEMDLLRFEFEISSFAFERINSWKFWEWGGMEARLEHNYFCNSITFSV